LKTEEDNFDEERTVWKQEGWYHFEYSTVIGCN